MTAISKIMILLAIVIVVGGIALGIMSHKTVAPVVVQQPPQHVALTQPVEKKVEEPAYKRDMLEDTATVDAPVAEKATGQEQDSTELQLAGLPQKMLLSSQPITPNEKILLYYTCYQKNISPPLEWLEAPSGVKSFVVLLESADQGKQVPWLWAVYNIPKSINSLPEGLPKVANVPGGFGQMASDSGNSGYTGPCQPKGEHHYNFEVFALDKELGLKGGATQAEIIRAMNGHILDMGKLPFSHYYRL